MTHSAGLKLIYVPSKEDAPKKPLPDLPQKGGNGVQTRVRASAMALPKGKYADMSDLDFADEQQVQLRYQLLRFFASITVRNDLGSLILKGVGDCSAALCGIKSGTPAETAFKALGAGFKTGSTMGNDACKAIIEVNAKHKVKEANAKLEGEVYNTLSKVMSDTKKKLAEKFCFSKAKMTSVETYLGISKGLVKAWAGLIAKEAGVVGGISDGIKGITGIGKAVCAKINSHKVKKLDLSQGVISQIFDMADNAMIWSGITGCYNVIKGAGSIALTLTTGPLAWIGKLMIAAIEMIVKLVWRAYDAACVQDFCNQALKYFTPCRKNIRLPGIHHDANKYADWFGQYSIRTPVIGALAANSGFVTGYNLFSLDAAKKASKGDIKSAWDNWGGLQQWLSFYAKEQGLFFEANNNDVELRLKRAKDLCKAQKITVKNIALALAWK